MSGDEQPEPDRSVGATPETSSLSDAPQPTRLSSDHPEKPQDPGEVDLGLGAVDPVSAVPQEIVDASPHRAGSSPPEQPESEDGGLGAIEPVIAADPSAPTISLPLAEVPIPPLASEPGSETGIDESGEDVGLALPAEGARDGLDRSAGRRDQLLRRLAAAQRLVNQRIDSPGLAQVLIEQITAAHTAILAGPGAFETAERLLNQVEYRVAFSQRIATWTATYGLRIFLYELAWALLIGLGFLAGDSFGGVGSFEPPSSQLYYSLLWGALGGVMSAWVALARQAARDPDFQPYETLWYLVRPGLGLGMGGVTFLLLWALVTSLGGAPIQWPALIYGLAWIGGYQASQFNSLLNRLTRITLSWLKARK